MIPTDKKMEKYRVPRKIKKCFKYLRIEQMMPEVCEIVSIKRLRDGQVFKVGDMLSENSQILHFGIGNYGSDISIMFHNPISKERLFIHGSCQGTLKPNPGLDILRK